MHLDTLALASTEMLGLHFGVVQSASSQLSTQDHSFPNNELCLLKKTTTKQNKKNSKTTQSITLFMGINNPIQFHGHKQAGQ